MPGDNDIGGEGGEPVRPDRAALFRTVFGGTDTAIVDFVQLYKVTWPGLLFSRGDNYRFP